MWAKNKNGFTIVELLIVIVVIGILAALSLVAFGEVRTRASTASRISEVKQWEKIFRLYRASENTWPSSIVNDKYYCLGSDFPVGGGGVPRCREYLGTGTQSYIESENIPVMNQLSAVSTLPTFTKQPVDVTAGPYFRLYGDGSQTVEITHVFSASNAACPSGMNQQFRNTTRLWCEVRLTP